MCSRDAPPVGINHDGSPICNNPAWPLGFGTARTSVVPSAGTYSGTATYTATMPWIADTA